MRIEWQHNEIDGAATSWDDNNCKMHLSTHKHSTSPPHVTFSLNVLVIEVKAGWFISTSCVVLLMHWCWWLWQGESSAGMWCNGSYTDLKTYMHNAQDPRWVWNTNRSAVLSMLVCLARAITVLTERRWCVDDPLSCEFAYYFLEHSFFGTLL